MEVKKFQFKQLETQIKNIVKLLGLSLVRLHKHCSNIKRLSALQDWQELHKEQINTDRTIQQINTNIQEIQRLRRQVHEDDLPQFDLRVQEVKDQSVIAVEEFHSLIKQEMKTPNVKKSSVAAVEYGTGDINWDDMMSSAMPSTSQHIPSNHIANSQSNHSKSSTNHIPDLSSIPSQRPPTHGRDSSLDYDTLDNQAGMIQTSQEEDWTYIKSQPQQRQQQMQQQQMQQQQTVPYNVMAEWETQREKIEAINEMTHMFAQEVESQQERVNSIEENITDTQHNVSKGAKSLGMANKYKAAIFPVVGAGVGLLVGGPIGFVAGLKLGGVAAVGGSALGYAGGRYIQKRHVKSVDMEMTRLSKSSNAVVDGPENSESSKGHNQDNGSRWSNLNPFK